MNSRRAVATVIAVLLLAVPESAPNAAAATPRPGCADSWRNGAGGIWSAGPNWSTGQPPAAHQAACITRPLDGAVVLNSAGTAGSLLLGASNQLVLQGG